MSTYEYNINNIVNNIEYNINNTEHNINIINTYQLDHKPISRSAKLSIYEYNTNIIYEYNINNIENNIEYNINIIK